MLLAAVVVIVAIGIGIALALLPLHGNRGLGLLRTFALAASISVVAFHLLPEATSEIGWWALAGTFLTLALPRLIGHAFGSSHGEAPFALELGYAGLIVHSVSDGLALGRFATGDKALGARLDLMLAVSAHTVPVVALLVLVYAAKSGIAAGVLRALGLAAATLAGVVLAAKTTLTLHPVLDASIAAAVSGLLLHIVAHGLELDPPASALARNGDLLIALTGLGLGLWLERDGHHEGETLGGTIQDHALELTLSWAPLLLLSLLAGTVWELTARRARGRLHPSLPPRQHGAGAEVLVLSLGLLGWRLSVLRLLPLLSRWLGGAAQDSPPEPPTPREPAWLAVSARHGAALVGGLLLSAIALGVDEPAARGWLMQLGAALAVAIVSHYSPLAATPLSAVLLGANVPAYCVVLGWCVGALTISMARARWLPLLLLELVVASLLVLATALIPTSLPVPSMRPLPVTVSIGAATVLGVWLALGLWQQGLRRWIWAAAAGSGYAAGHGGNRFQQDPARRDPVSQSLRG